MPSQKGFGVILLLIIFAFSSVAIVGGTYVASKQPFFQTLLNKNQISTPSKTSTDSTENKQGSPSALPEKTWKKLTDSTFNFSLDYPADLFLKEVTDPTKATITLKKYYLNNSEIMDEKNHLIEINISKITASQINQFANFKNNDLEIETDISEITILNKNGFKLHNKKYEIKNPAMQTQLDNTSGPDSYFIPLNNDIFLEINYFSNQENIVQQMIDSLQISELNKQIFTPTSQLYSLIYPKRWQLNLSGGVAGTDCGQFFTEQGFIRSCVFPTISENKDLIVSEFAKSGSTTDIKTETLNIKSHPGIWVERFSSEFNAGVIYISIDDVKYAGDNNEQLAGHLVITATSKNKHDFDLLKEECKEILNLLTF